MKYNNTLCFVGGLGLGLVAGVLGCKKWLEKKYADQYEDQIAQMEAYYKKSDEYARVEYEETEEEYNPKDDQNEAHEMTQEERNQVKQELKRKKDEEKIAYNKAYQEPEEDYDEEEDDSMERKAHEMHQATKDLPPEIIGPDEAMEMRESEPYVDHEDLFYYTYNDIMVDEEGDIVEPEKLIGSKLDDILGIEEESVYVMNHSLSTCYYVTKLPASYDVTSFE